MSLSVITGTVLLDSPGPGEVTVRDDGPPAEEVTFFPDEDERETFESSSTAMVTYDAGSPYPAIDTITPM